MAVLVQKFGGTSVGSVDRIQAVARRIAESKELGNELVIVVSAMGHTTDELTLLAQKISKNRVFRTFLKFESSDRSHIAYLDRSYQYLQLLYGNRVP